MDLFRTLNISLRNQLHKIKSQITETEDKIPSITGLAATVASNVVENKISSVSNLVKEASYEEKILHIGTKYFTTSDCNKFKGEILNTKIKEKEVFNKSHISGFINN